MINSRAIKLKMWAVMMACLGFVTLASHVSATSLTFGDMYDLGIVIYGIPTGDQNRTSYVNELISLAPGTTNFFDPVTGQTYTRSSSTYGSPYPTAVFDHNNPGGSPNDFININLGAGGYQYLFAKYDGTNYGAEVWDLSGLTGTIMIPEFASPNGQNQISGWTLFTGNPQVPDGGGTALLLGATMSAIGLVRRKLS